MLKKGVEIWNQWRQKKSSLKPDLSGAILGEADLRGANLCEAILCKADLSGSNLSKANLHGADLSKADLTNANLHRADLSESNLTKAILKGADLSKADLSKANLTGANLEWENLIEAKLNEANLTIANLRGANLENADLREANLREANLTDANLCGVDFSGANLGKANLTAAKMISVRLNGTILTDCKIYGVSTWDLKGLDEAEQSNLVITDSLEPEITVDNLEVAQFIYILLHSEKIRNVIDTLTSKAVLILGRFTPERKAILDAIRAELRKRNYLPILFDFEKPKTRNLTETVSTLAHMARFIIADITDPKSIPQELQRIVPDLPSVPVQPILQLSNREWGMFESFKDYNWVLETYLYNDTNDLLNALAEKVITPAELKANQIREARALRQSN